MSTPHVIRLRGPWEFAVIARFDGGRCGESSAAAETSTSPDALPSTGRLQMPADWGETLGREFRGKVAYRRRFGRPTGIDDHQRVWLVCDGADAWARLTLNGQWIGDVAGPATRAEFDVTSRLHNRNELVATVECPRLTVERKPIDRGQRASLPGGLIGEVRLEIRGGDPSGMHKA